MRLLSLILDILFPLRDTEALVRSTTREDLLILMKPEMQGSRTTLLPYRHPRVRACILEAKFKGNSHAQQLLGEVLRTYIKNASVIVLPIPLGSKRKKERGYNQVEEIAKRSGLLVNTHILKRTRETLPQTEQSGRNRKENVRDAFVATDIDPSTPYLVLDDVMTTGSTLREAAMALRSAGTKRIELLALAH
ncbi:MAG: hypothetical protein AAB582_00720 [Patescibacteria group bacterium]